MGTVLKFDPEARSRANSRRMMAEVLMELVEELEEESATLFVVADADGPLRPNTWGADEIQKARTEISAAAGRLRAVAASMGVTTKKETES